MAVVAGVAVAAAIAGGTASLGAACAPGDGDPPGDAGTASDSGTPGADAHTAEDAALDASTEPDSGQPQTPLLADAHAGWANPDCATCHDLPVTGHWQTETWQCAGCHGGNGACDPAASSRDHRRSEPCVDCHQARHGFTQANDCAQCHFAFTGLRDCTL